MPPKSPTAAWLKKRLLLESLVATLPPPDAAAAADDSITCDFLLRLLRTGSMVGADAALLRELESRAARRLDQASLGALMVPASVHAQATLLDVPLVLRPVRGFLKERGKGEEVPARGWPGWWTRTWRRRRSMPGCGLPSWRSSPARGWARRTTRAPRQRIRRATAVPGRHPRRGGGVRGGGASHSL